MSALSPWEVMLTETCPGVWPGVETRRIASLTRWSTSTRSTTPASKSGKSASSQEGRFGDAFSSPEAAFQCS